ncbi:hypothetical protein [Mangrovicoccus ximenensis]|uniref:hypothetical protein n=1 Tax=Mangrovicoccus ximenensis TaxID=1911570 RepID=UPI000D3B7784|nr:hypothetical protein [Mangrovicoccus ximenensis]
MPITPRAVTVTVNGPAGALEGVAYRFILRGLGLTGDGNLVTNPPGYVTGTSSASGLVEVELWPNDEGSAPTYYEVQEFQTRSTGKQAWETIGALLVPSSGAATIDVMLVGQLPPNTGPHVLLTEAQFDALDAATLKKTDISSQFNESSSWHLFEDGMLVCTRQVVIGNPLAAGIGDHANPYRSAPQGASWARPFAEPPTISFAVADASDIPHGAQVSSVTATGYTGLRSVRLNASATPSTPVIHITARGPAA